MKNDRIDTRINYIYLWQYFSERGNSLKEKAGTYASWLLGILFGILTYMLDNNNLVFSCEEKNILPEAKKAILYAAAQHCCRSKAVVLT